MKKAAYFVTKTFGHELGLSCCFRQWRAEHSHCQFLHGYSLSVEFKIAAGQLDERNWTFDFGGFADIRRFLQNTFDHKLVVAEDDPRKDEICLLGALGVADVLVLPAVGCEQFAAYIWEHCQPIIHKKTDGRAFLFSVEVREHGANSATYAATDVEN